MTHERITTRAYTSASAEAGQRNSVETQAGWLRPGSLLGPRIFACLRASSRGPEAAFFQLEQTHTPGVGIAVRLLGQQVAVGGVGADADQDRFLTLVDLIVGADLDGG